MQEHVIRWVCVIRSGDPRPTVAEQEWQKQPVKYEGHIQFADPGIELALGCKGGGEGL